MLHRRLVVLLAALALPLSAGATPPSDLPGNPLDPAVALVDKQSLPKPGTPAPIYVEFVRQDTSQTLYLEIRAADAEVLLDGQQQSGAVLIKSEESASGILHTFDIGALPPGQPSQILFSFELKGEVGSGVHAALWDDLGNSADAFLDFAIDDGGVVSQAASAGQILLDQLARFQKADQWAAGQLQIDTAVQWEPDPGDPDEYAVTSSRKVSKKILRWPKGTARTRRLSKLLHAQWNAGINRHTGVQFSGRLVFRDDAGCNSPTTAHEISWAECHAFKRHVDASGAPITIDASFAPAYRPLPATVALSYEAWRNGVFEKLCDLAVFQADDNGRFLWELAPCNVPAGEGLQFKLIGTAFLQNQVFGAPDAPTSETGFVRAVWPVSDMEALFGTGSAGSVIRWLGFNRANDDGTVTRYSMPAIRFTHVIAAPEPAGGAVPMGMRILGTGWASAYDYLRNVLSGFTTIVQLHLRMQEKLADDAQYTHMFRDGSSFRRNYMIWFDNSWAYGWAGGIALLKPRFDVNPRLLSETEMLAHEFGHSVHGALAGISMVYDYSFANLMMLPPSAPDTEKIYDWGHAPGQFQEMGAAFTEGIASSIGQYLLNDCGAALASRRNIGTISPFSNNQWSGEGPDATTHTAAPIHHYRWFVRNVAGIAEPSTPFTSRLSALQTLTTNAPAAANALVKSNDEGRWGVFGCDLLDAQSDISYVAGMAPASYVVDFTHDAWRVMTGRNATGTPGRVEPWVAPAGENVQLTLAQLLDVMGNFCPRCSGAVRADDYGPVRLSTRTSRQSPQTFARFVSTRGYATLADVRDVMRANFMETYGLE